VIQFITYENKICNLQCVCLVNVWQYNYFLQQLLLFTFSDE